MIARLSAKGLVKKENRDGNNKELFLSLTESGWKAFNAHECFHDKHMADLTRHLSPKFTVAEMSKASELLAMIENVLDKRISKFAGNELPRPLGRGSSFPCLFLRRRHNPYAIFPALLSYSRLKVYVFQCSF